ncbi:MAG TPA: hypothetical protein VGC93_03790 [Thermoanaerobaculia bacterium]
MPGVRARGRSARAGALDRRAVAAVLPGAGNRLLWRRNVARMPPGLRGTAPLRHVAVAAFMPPGPARRRAVGVLGALCLRPACGMAFVRRGLAAAGARRAVPVRVPAAAEGLPPFLRIAKRRRALAGDRLLPAATQQRDQGEPAGERGRV